MNNPFEELKQELESIKTMLREKQGEEILTTEQVAELLHVTRQTVYNWKESGELKAYGIGKAVRYKKSEVIAALVRINGKAA